SGMPPSAPSPPASPRRRRDRDPPLPASGPSECTKRAGWRPGTVGGGGGVSPTVAASYRAGPAPLPSTGFRAPAGAEDEIHVFDHLGSELLASLAPPFVSPAALERYEPVATKVAGVDLTVAWTLRRWPGGRDGHQWVQEFRD